MKASDIKKGMVIESDGASIFVSEVQVQTASSRSGNTLYKVRGRNVVTRQKFQASWKGDEVVQTVEFERRPYDGRAAYAQSKQADRLYTWALARRLEGTGVTANAAWPAELQLRTAE